MFDKARDFIKKYSALLSWTGAYWTLFYMLFFALFNFNLLSASHWLHIGHISLRGIPGLCFAFMMLGMIPIYIATAAFVYKNSKWPFSFIPKKKKEEDKAAPAPEKPTVIQDIEIPSFIPREMQEPFVQVKQREFARFTGYPRADTATDLHDLDDDAPVAALPSADDLMPLPDDFTTTSATAAPVFKSMSFGGDAPDADTPKFDDIKLGDKDSAPTVVTQSTTAADLTAMGFMAITDGDIVIASSAGKKFAVATHDDADFWIADGVDWFATGKQKPSPTGPLLAAAKKHGAEPVLYLAANNIMNLADQIQKWNEAGVRVALTLSDIVTSD